MKSFNGTSELEGHIYVMKSFYWFIFFLTIQDHMHMHKHENKQKISSKTKTKKEILTATPKEPSIHQ